MRAIALVMTIPPHAFSELLEGKLDRLIVAVLNTKALISASSSVGPSLPAVQRCSPDDADGHDARSRRGSFG